MHEIGNRRKRHGATFTRAAVASRESRGQVRGKPSGKSVPREINPLRTSEEQAATWLGYTPRYNLPGISEGFGKINGPSVF